jgi:hypothetical protein
VASVVFVRSLSVAVAALLATVVVACQAVGRPPPAPLHTPHATLHPQLVELEATLTDRFGMRFANAGPHHRLGKAGGVEVDLVGAPIEEVVVSLPLDEAHDLSETLTAYLRPIEEALGRGEGLVAWTAETLRGWDRHRPLHAEAAIDGLSVRMTTSEDPSFLVLVVVHGDG